MRDDLSTSQGGPEHSPVFDTTHWSVVVAAGAEASAEAAVALENLCRAYWSPLYAYVRRQGRSPHDAEDLVQEFFARFLERNHVRLADPERGRFRTFLLTSLKHFLINEWKQASRVKRGGGCRVFPLDAPELETRIMGEPGTGWSPDKAYDRQWALVVLGRVLDQLEAGLAASGRQKLFAVLKPCLVGEDDEGSYAEMATRLEMTPGNVKVTVHRLRQQYRDLLKQEIARTVNEPALVEEEIRHLISALSD